MVIRWKKKWFLIGIILTTSMLALILSAYLSFISAWYGTTPGILLTPFYTLVETNPTLIPPNVSDPPAFVRRHASLLRSPTLIQIRYTPPGDSSHLTIGSLSSPSCRLIRLLTRVFRENISPSFIRNTLSPSSQPSRILLREETTTPFLITLRGEHQNHTAIIHLITTEHILFIIGSAYPPQSSLNLTPTLITIREVEENLTRQLPLSFLFLTSCRR